MGRASLAHGAVFVALSTAPVLIRANFTDARIWGVEYTIDARLHRNWTFGGNFRRWRRIADEKRIGVRQLLRLAAIVDDEVKGAAGRRPLVLLRFQDVRLGFGHFGQLAGPLRRKGQFQAFITGRNEKHLRPARGIHGGPGSIVVGQRVLARQAQFDSTLAINQPLQRRRRFLTIPS